MASHALQGSKLLQPAARRQPGCFKPVAAGRKSRATVVDVVAGERRSANRTKWALGEQPASGPSSETAAARAPLDAAEQVRREGR